MGLERGFWGLEREIGAGMGILRLEWGGFGGWNWNFGAGVRRILGLKQGFWGWNEDFGMGMGILGQEQEFLGFNGHFWAEMRRILGLKQGGFWRGQGTGAHLWPRLRESRPLDLLDPLYQTGVRKILKRKFCSF